MAAVNCLRPMDAARRRRELASEQVRVPGIAQSYSAVREEGGSGGGDGGARAPQVSPSILALPLFLSPSLPPRIFVSTYHDGSWGSHQGSPPPFPSLCGKYRPIDRLTRAGGRVGEDIEFPNRLHFTRPIGSFSAAVHLS